MTFLTAEQLQRDWDTNPRWKGVKRGYSAADVVRLRGSVPVEHSLAKLGAEKLWRHMQTSRSSNSLGALTGNQAMQQVKAGLPAIYLSGWQVAGDANVAGADVPRPVALPGELGAGGRAQDQQHAAARRPDPPRRGQRLDRLAAADRGRRRGGLRRRAERLRADEGDDRGGRGGRPLRGPAVVGQEVRPHGRQGAGADAGGIRSWSPRGSRPTPWACRRCCSRAPTPRAPT